MEKIDGNAVKQARLLKRRNASNRRGTPGSPAEGTVEWLAMISGCSPRTIKEMERGFATIETLDKVSPFLDLDGRLLIPGYGSEDINCTADQIVDFRPATCPWDDNNDFDPDFILSPMLLTLDPMTFILEWDELKHVDIKNVIVQLSGLEAQLDFAWLYEVSLTPAAEGWLGIQKEMWPFRIHPNDQQQVHMPIMFKQDDLTKMPWDEFVVQVNKTESPQLRLDVTVDCERFNKQFARFVSTDHLKALFAADCERRKMKWPVRAQCRLLGY